MTDMGMIGGVAASLRLMGDITKVAIEARDIALMREKVIELQTVIMTAQSGAITAQSDQFLLLERVRELEAKLAKLEAWDAERARYALQDLGNGVLAYVVKPYAQVAEPSHAICPDCYEEGVKSILQTVTRFPGRAEVRVCQKCGWEGYVEGTWQPEHGGGKRASRRR
jgi:hypothetical protein